MTKKTTTSSASKRVLPAPGGDHIGPLLTLPDSELAIAENRYQQATMDLEAARESWGLNSFAFAAASRKQQFAWKRYYRLGRSR